MLTDPHDSEVSFADRHVGKKRMKMETSESHSGNGSSGSGGTDPGVNGVPIELSHTQHSRKIDKFTIPYAGTTWVDMSTDGTNENMWSYFPWEFMKHAITSWTTQEIANKYMYWKATHIEIVFKNPICHQEISSAGGTVISGLNTSAQLYGYLDDMYLQGIATRPFPNNDTVGTIDSYYDLMRSWKNQGQSGGVITLLPKVNMESTIMSHNYPDVKAISCSAGQSMQFGWNIHSPYWRATGDFMNTPQSSGGASDNQLLRWDESCGMIGCWFSATQNAVTVQSCPENFDTRQTATNVNWAGATFGTGAVLTNFGQPFMCSDPIPRLYLTLQPQTGGIATGATPSQCQVQFEAHITIACTGRTPRILNIEPTNIKPNSGQFGNGREAVNTLPIYRHVFIRADTDLD